MELQLNRGEMSDQSIQDITNASLGSSPTPSAAPPTSPKVSLTPPAVPTPASTPKPIHNPASFIGRKVVTQDGSMVQLGKTPSADTTRRKS